MSISSPVRIIVTGNRLGWINLPREPGVIIKLIRGEKGEPGSAGVAPYAAALIAPKIADVAIGGFRAVKSTSATGVDYADCNTAGDAALLLGVTNNSSGPAGSLDVVVNGYITDAGFNWVPQEPVYVARTGRLTQIDPAGAFLMQVAIAVSATTIYVSPQEPLYF